MAGHSERRRVHMLRLLCILPVDVQKFLLFSQGLTAFELFLNYLCDGKVLLIVLVLDGEQLLRLGVSEENANALEAEICRDEFLHL